MMNTQPLISEQRQFAEDNHDIIYSFLRYKHLSYDYYDIIVFGYLRAVKKYFNRSELHRYRFNTIAYDAMNSDLYNHYRKQYRQKRMAYTVSFDTVCDDTVGINDDTIDNLLIEEALSELPTYQANVILMKSHGYTEREISKHYGASTKSIKEMLSSIRELLYPRLV